MVSLDKSLILEEQDLLFEIDSLSKLIEETKHILQVKKSLELLVKAHGKSDTPNIKTYTQLIESAFAKERGFSRAQGRVERRRFVHEEKVLQGLKSLEETISPKELEQIISFIRVHSATLVRELSLYTGELVKAIDSCNETKVAQIEGQAHAAAMGLLTLVKQLEQVQRKKQKKFSEHPHYSEGHELALGLSGFLRESAIKTIHIKSIPAVRRFIESGTNKIFRKKRLFEDEYHSMLTNPSLGSRGFGLGKKWQNILVNNKDYLLRRLSQEEFLQLSRLNFIVPKEGIILFIPGSTAPVLGLHLQHMPSFEIPGWATHYFSGLNLAPLLKSGEIITPLSQIKSKTKYLTGKNSAFVTRVTDGISTGFQDYQRWAAYVKDPNYGVAGGMLLFPFSTILSGNRTLDFASTMDHFPEACIREKRLGGDFSIETIGQLLSAKRTYEMYLESLPLAELAYHAAQDIDPEFVSILEQNQAEDVAMYRHGGELKITKGYNRDQVVLYKKKLPDNFFIVEGTSILQDVFAQIIFAKEKRFAQFSFAFLRSKGVSLPSEKRYMIPKIQRMNDRSLYDVLSGTSFYAGLDYVGLPSATSSVMNTYLITSMMANGGLSWIGKGHRRRTKGVEDYFHDLEFASIRTIKKVVSQSHSQAIQDIRQIIKNTTPKTEKLVEIPLQKTVLFLNWSSMFPQVSKGSKLKTVSEDFVVKHILKHKIPSILYLNNNANGMFDSKQMEFLLRGAIGVNDILGIGPSARSDSCYFVKEDYSIVLVNRRKGSKTKIV